MGALKGRAALGVALLPRNRAWQPLPVSGQWVHERLQDVAWVARARQRLQSLGWFMKFLKESLSRLANLASCPAH